MSSVFLQWRSVTGRRSGRHLAAGVSAAPRHLHCSERCPARVSVGLGVLVFVRVLPFSKGKKEPLDRLLLDMKITEANLKVRPTLALASFV